MMDHCVAKKIFGEKPMKKIDTSHIVNVNEYPIDHELHHQVPTNGSDRLSDLDSLTQMLLSIFRKSHILYFLHSKRIQSCIVTCLMAAAGSLGKGTASMRRR